MSLPSTILLTRDLRACRLLAKKIKIDAPNAKLILAPVRKILALSYDEIDLGLYDALIFTSSNGVGYFKGDIFGKHCLVVGSRTALIAREKGANVQAVHENIRQLETNLAQMSAQNILYISGNVIESHFYQAPEISHHTMKRIVVYRALHRAWDAKEISAMRSYKEILAPVFSKEGARSLLRNLEGNLLQIPLRIYPISANVADCFEKSDALSIATPPYTPNWDGLWSGMREKISD